MLLSVCMITKNEEKYMERCLTALRPIGEAIAMEVIIIDSGSTDATVAIAQQYGAKVHSIEWRNDFAWARNQAFKHATGRWFLLIDPDEILENPDELIQFFKTNQYKKFASASVKITNMYNETPGNYFRMYRLVSKTSQPHFTGAIHERLEPVYVETNCLLEANFLHYGYDWASDPNLQAEKVARNGPLVIAAYEEDPDNPNKLSHLIDHYGIDLDLERRLNLSRLGIRKHFENPLFHTVFLDRFLVFATDRAKASHLVEAYEDEKEIRLEIEGHLNDYFDKCKIKYTSYPRFKFFQGDNYQVLKKYKEAAKSYQQGVQVFRDHEKRKHLDAVIETVLSFKQLSAAEVARYDTLSSASYGDFRDFIKVSESPVDTLLDFVYEENFLQGNNNLALLESMSEMALGYLLTKRYDNQTNVDLFNAVTMVRVEYLTTSKKKESEYTKLDNFSTAVSKAYEFQGFPLIKALTKAKRYMPALDFATDMVIASLEESLKTNQE